MSINATVTAAGSGMLMNEEPAIGSSDTDGNFELTGLRSGTYHVTISDFGDIEFPVTTRDVTVGVGLSANVSFNAPGEDQPTTGGTDAFLVITGITDASDDDDTYSGRVTASVDIERGDARFEKIALYVDAAEVASQSFGLEPAPAEDPDLAAQQTVFSLSFDSDEYDETGAVTYSNGAHDIVVGLTVQGSTEEAFSNRMEVEFDNPDGVHVAVSGQTRLPVIGQDGGYWYGGPDAGFDLTAVPVIYSGSPVPSVTLREGFCGENDGEALAAAPYTFTPDCDGYEGSVDPNSFSIGPAAVQTLNAEDEVFSIQLDYAGPGAPVFMPNPNDREDGWINDAVGLVAKHDVEENDDGWLIYGATDGGVGGNTVQLQVGEDLEGALAATASSSPTLPAASEDNNDAYCFVASAVDDLGNSSKLPDEDGDCSGPGDYMDAVTAVEGMGDEGDDDYVAPVDAADAMVFSSITAGVDTEAPTIEFTPNSLEDESRALDRAYDLRVKDAGSGLHSSMPVLARVAVRDAKKATCGDDEDGLPGHENDLEECENSTEGLGELDDDRVLAELHEVEDLADGYYTFTALAQDKAGNKSDEISRVAVHDTEDPVVSVAATTGSKDGDLDHNLVGTVTDALSIRDYSIAALVDGVYYGLESGLVDVDAYDADPTTPSVSVDEAITLPFLGLQKGILDPVKVTELQVSVRDQADGADKDQDGVDISADLEDSKFTSALGFKVTPDDDDEASTLEIKAEVTREENPFESVLFYAAADEGNTDLRFIASVPDYSARESGGKWTYTARVSADDFYAAVGGDGDYSGKVYAVGVREAGSVAGSEVVSTVTTTTTDALQEVVTTDGEDRVTSTRNLYAGNAVDFDVESDADYLDADGMDENPDNDFGSGVASFSLPTANDPLVDTDDELTSASAIRSTVTTIDLVTNNMGTVDDVTDDVATRTSVETQTTIRVTKAGEDAVDADASATPPVEAKDAVMPEGELVTITTTTTVTSHVGQAAALTLDLDETLQANATIVAETVVGEADESDAITVEIAADETDVSQLATSGTVVATAGDTTTTIDGNSIAIAVETSAPGESTEVEGGVGLVVESADPQKVDER